MPTKTKGRSNAATKIVKGLTEAVAMAELRRAESKIQRLERINRRADKALGERLADLKVRDARIAELEGMLAGASESLAAATRAGESLCNTAELWRERATVAARQLITARDLFDGLAQRYVGFRMSVGHSSIRTGRDEHKAELDGFGQALGETALVVTREFTSARRNDEERQQSHAGDATRYGLGGGANAEPRGQA